MRSTFRIRKQDIPRAGGSGRRTVGLQGSRLGKDGMPTDQCDQETTVPPTFRCIVSNCPERFLSSTNKRNPMLTDGITKTMLDQQFILRKQTALLN